jgi:PKD repeat protein
MSIRRTAKDTITAIDMNVGDTLYFTLRSGDVRVFTLLGTHARLIYTNLDRVKDGRPGGATILHFSCEARVDGHVITLERFVGSQESFYVPYVINGVRIWFDAVAEIFEFLNEDHGLCRPSKQARFAISDAKDRICPDVLRTWCPLPSNTLDISDCYNGDDCWLGPYFGADAHGGLDVNHPKGTPIWAPIAIDDHYLFESLEAGHNNNRWRGIRQWPDGDVWILQNHHILNLLVPEHTPIPSGALYAQAAGVHVGSHEHSHFAFRVQCAQTKEQVLLDPWILFWQTFEDRRQRRGEIRAEVRPLQPARVGQPISFGSEGSSPGPNGTDLVYYWTFGDGGWSNAPNPTHVYAKPGMYAVTLTVDDGSERHSCAQHLTIDGEELDSPCFGLAAPDEITFDQRRLSVQDIYGEPVRFLPHTLYLVARPTRPRPSMRVIHVHNVGKGELPPVEISEIRYSRGSGWLTVELAGEGDGQTLRVQADATGLSPGEYVATVEVICPGAVNEVQGFLVRLLVPAQQPLHRELGHLKRVVVDDSDTGFCRSPYFWVGHRVHRVEKRGFRGFSLTNGGRATPGEYARFTPDLATGEYRVELHDETPFEGDPGFFVRVRHSLGDDTIWIEPAKSRTVGVFHFDEGTDGFVEILAEDSRGHVIADAVSFMRVDQET